MHPLYRQLEGSGNGGPPSEEVLLERALFGGERGLAAVLGGAHARDAAVRRVGEVGRRMLRRLGCSAEGNAARMRHAAWLHAAHVSGMCVIERPL